MSCATTHFHEFPFCDPHVKPCEVRGLSNNFYIWLKPKLVHDQCEIRWITCAYVSCTNILDKPWYPGGSHIKQQQYQPVFERTYRPVFLTLNNLNMNHFTNKATSSEDLMILKRLFLLASVTIWHIWFSLVNGLL